MLDLILLAFAALGFASALLVFLFVIALGLAALRREEPPMGWDEWDDDVELYVPADWEVRA